MYETAHTCDNIKKALHLSFDTIPTMQQPEFSLKDHRNLNFEIKKNHTGKAYRNGGKVNYVHLPVVLSKIFERSI